MVLEGQGIHGGIAIGRLHIFQNSQQVTCHSHRIIILARELMPEDTMSFDKANICSMVTQHGSANSHTAILARVMDIPAVIGIAYDDNLNGKMAIVDGYEGKLIIDPSEQELKVYKKRQKEELEKKRLLTEYKGEATITKNGRRILLYANIGNVADVKAVLDNDGEGIGLFRSEFLYMESEDYPDEETLYEAYKTVAEALSPKKVVIRTLDIGDDKQLAYFNLPMERNPALGHRGIRVCLSQRDVFKTQLRAIYRASAYGELSILFPMIVDVSEIKEIKAIIEEVKRELKDTGIAYKDCAIGAMIETPAAVMISDLLAQEVDFLSVGTNDLTQYTLAVDRENESMQSLYNPYHKAILRMLSIVVDNGHKAGCEVGICGELASDLRMTEELVRLGFDSISVSPSSILPIRETVLKYIDKTTQSE